MGWSWSFLFCQEMATELATKNLPHGRRGLATERSPPPPLLLGRPVTGVYVDNGVEADAAFAAAAAASAIGVHGDTPGRLLLDTLSVVFGFTHRTFRHRPRRVWRLYWATASLIGSSTARGRDVGVWVGHVVNFCSLEPSGFPCLQRTYPFIFENYSKRVLLPEAVREVMVLVMGF